MFPINFNFPYRKKDGSLITMEKALDGAGADLDLIDLDDVAITDPAEGDGLIYDNTAHKWKNIPIISRILTLFNAWKKNGAYNLCPNKGTTQTVQSVTVTVNANLTLSTSGTASANGYFDIFPKSTELFLEKGKTYKLIDGTENDATVIGVQIFFYDSTNTLLGFYGKGDTFTVPNNTYYIYVALKIQNTVDFSGKTFKPLITSDLNATAADYVPYAMTNRELTEFTTTEDVTSKITFSQSITWHTGWNHICRCGKQVWGSIRFTTPSTASNDFPIITLPTELRPAVSSGVVIGSLHETWSGTVVGMLNTGGSDIALASNQWSTNKNVVCTFSYLTS